MLPKRNIYNIYICIIQGKDVGRQSVLSYI